MFTITMGQRISALVTRRTPSSAEVVRYRLRCEDVGPGVLASIRRAKERGVNVRVIVDCKRGGGAYHDEGMAELERLVGAHRLVLAC